MRTLLLVIIAVIIATYVGPVAKAAISNTTVHSTVETHTATIDSLIVE